MASGRPALSVETDREPATPRVLFGVGAGIAVNLIADPEAPHLLPSAPQGASFAVETRPDGLTQIVTFSVSSPAKGDDRRSRKEPHTFRLHPSTSITALIRADRNNSRRSGRVMINGFESISVVFERYASVWAKAAGGGRIRMVESLEADDTVAAFDGPFSGWQMLPLSRSGGDMKLIGHSATVSIERAAGIRMSASVREQFAAALTTHHTHSL